MDQYPDGAPKAPKHSFLHSVHGITRNDDYYWLRERENPEVINYLKAENDYLEKVMQPHAPLQQELFEEMKGRLKPTDLSVPYALRGYWYYVRYEEGKEYPIYCRKTHLDSNEEEIILDVNQEAQGHDYFHEQGLTVSPDNQWLALGLDRLGRRQYTLKVKNLSTGAWLDFEEANTDGSYAWAADNQTLFFNRKDEETLRTHQIWRCRPFDSSQAELVVEEKDEAFQIDLSKSQDDAYILLSSISTLQTEVWYISATQPADAPKRLSPRQGEHLYYADHFQGSFYLLSNWKAKNFKIARCLPGQENPNDWETILAEQNQSLLEGMHLNTHGIVVEERREAHCRLRLLDFNGNSLRQLPMEDPTGTCWAGTNPDANQVWFRFGFTSFTCPQSIKEWNLATGEERLLKKQEVLGGFEEEAYQSERCWAEAKDGTKIPISLVYKKSSDPNQAKGPLLLYGYGSYGASMDSGFSSTRLSLLNRGWTFAIAHIRGGQEMGRTWYEQGRLEHKMNSFTDFIDCAHWLIDHGYAAKDRVHAMGGSAGGLLMGAVMNLEPQLFRSMVAQVPFVDVLTTMLDTSIPLTTGEFNEWGNPADVEGYAWIEKYSPYDNVEAKDYPNLLVTTGLHDSQVQYWEPAKWVAKLRAMRSTSDKKLLLHTDLSSGHGGKTGRYARLEEVALEYAFLLACAQ